MPIYSKYVISIIINGSIRKDCNPRMFNFIQAMGIYKRYLMPHWLIPHLGNCLSPMKEHLPHLVY